jgi:exodeoxyribonuclease-5
MIIPAGASRVEYFRRSLEQGLPFEPTNGQSEAIYALSRFLDSKKEKCCFLLKGYAGTGKTSLMKSMVEFLESESVPYKCLAPTGRAAKVLSSYTGRRAFTIHKHIYKRVLDTNTGKSIFMMNPNRRKGMVFIVDEASMIADGSSLLGNDLLEDLLEHVYAAPGCRLLLIGDEAQLPPVHLDRSPAMDADLLAERYDLVIAERHLTEVVRQATDSGILEYATEIRKRIEEETPSVQSIPIPAADDISYLSPIDLPDLLQSCYDKYGLEGVKVICRSNKDANSFNHQIRNRVFYHDEKLSAGEMLMVVRNNYLWMGEGVDVPFIANGEMAELMYMSNNQDLYEGEFADAGLRFVDQEGEPVIDCKLMIEVLDATGPSISEERSKFIYHAVREDLSHEYSGSELRSAMRKDPYYNALQVKYGYAVTCHKAQGGQWPVVIIYGGYLTEEMIDRGYWRWLYTAVTRATTQLYIIQ